MSAQKEMNVFRCFDQFHLLKPSQLLFQLSPRFDLSKSHLHLHQVIIINIYIIIPFNIIILILIMIIIIIPFIILTVVIIIIIVTLLMICLTGMLSNRDLYLCDITEKENISGKQKKWADLNPKVNFFVMTHVICCCQL